MRVEIPGTVSRTIGMELRHPDGLLQAGFLVGRIEDDIIKVRSVIIPEQQMQRGSTAIAPEALAAAQREAGAVGKRIVGLVHHFHKFPVYESATTAKTVRQLVTVLGHACVSLVVNNNDGEACHNLYEVPPPAPSEEESDDQSPTDA